MTSEIESRLDKVEERIKDLEWKLGKLLDILILNRDKFYKGEDFAYLQ